MHTCIHAYMHACMHAYIHTYKLIMYIYIYRERDTYNTMCIHNTYI